MDYIPLAAALASGDFEEADQVRPCYSPKHYYEYYFSVFAYMSLTYAISSSQFLFIFPIILFLLFRFFEKFKYLFAFLLIVISIYLTNKIYFTSSPSPRLSQTPNPVVVYWSNFRYYVEDPELGNVITSLGQKKGAVRLPFNYLNMFLHIEVNNA